jgi:hypothetical protein
MVDLVSEILGVAKDGGDEAGYGRGGRLKVR